MTTAAEFQSKVAKAEVNMDRLDGIVNGGPTTVVGTDGGNVPSIAKLEADLAAAIEGSITAGKANASAIGIATTAANMGTFTGGIIPDNVSAKAGMQALETALGGVDFLYTPDNTTATVSGAFTGKYWGPGDLALPSGQHPGDQGGATYGVQIYYPTTPASGQHFALVAKAWSGTRYDRGSAPGQNHIVAAYTEATRGAGSTDGAWAFNTITNAINLDGPTIGYECDMNNQSGIDPGLDPAQVYHGISIVSGDLYRGGTGLVVDRNGDHPNNHWNRGLHVKEVWRRGIEFTNCYNGASGIFSDRTIRMVQVAATDIPVLQINPFDDLNPNGAAIQLTNAANTTNKGLWLKRGEISLNGNANQGACLFGGKIINNGDNGVFIQRATDTTPTGQFLRFVNAAKSVVLMDVDHNSTAGETNFKLSVAGAAAVRVSVGPADSGGTGYRILRIPN
jgi:hypothetical protein